MRHATEDQIQAFKSSALASSGRDDIMLERFEDADVEVIVRAPTRAEWLEYLDAAMVSETTSSAYEMFAMRMALFPSRGELQKALDDFTSLPAQVCDLVEELAGRPTKRKEVRLSRETSAEDWAELGISAEQGAELLTRYPNRGQLRGIVADTFQCVVKRPTTLTSQRLRKTANEGKGYAQASLDAAIDCIVWPADDVARATFERYPAIPALAIVSTVIDLGDAGAVGLRKKL